MDGWKDGRLEGWCSGSSRDPAVWRMRQRRDAAEIWMNERLDD